MLHLRQGKPVEPSCCEVSAKACDASLRQISDWLVSEATFAHRSQELNAKVKSLMKEVGQVVQVKLHQAWQGPKHKFLESRAVQDDRPLYPKVAHNLSKEPTMRGHELSRLGFGPVSPLVVCNP